MTAPSVELQALVFDTLKADVDVMDIATDVYDNVPANAVKPYITFGPSDDNSDDKECIVASVHSLQIDVWSAKKAQEQCKNLAYLVKKALHDKDLVLPTHALVGIRASSGRILRGVDRLSNHGVVTVTALIEEN